MAASGAKLPFAGMSVVERTTENMLALMFSAVDPLRTLAPEQSRDNLACYSE